jgi:hypothetical protein
MEGADFVGSESEVAQDLVGVLPEGRRGTLHSGGGPTHLDDRRRASQGTEQGMVVLDDEVVDTSLWCTGTPGPATGSCTKGRAAARCTCRQGWRTRSLCVGPKGSCRFVQNSRLGGYSNIHQKRNRVRRACTSFR